MSELPNLAFGFAHSRPVKISDAIAITGLV